MKTLGLFVAATLLSAASFAQTTAAAKSPELKAQLKDLRKDVRAYNKEKAITKKEISKGELTKAQANLAVAKTDKKEVVADVKQLKSEGIEHPVVLAKVEIKSADAKKIKADVAELKSDKADLKADIKDGNATKEKIDKADVKAGYKEVKKDIRTARADGLKHIHHRVK